MKIVQTGRQLCLPSRQEVSWLRRRSRGGRFPGARAMQSSESASSGEGCVAFDGQRHGGELSRGYRQSFGMAWVHGFALGRRGKASARLFLCESLSIPVFVGSMLRIEYRDEVGIPVLRAIS